MRALPLPVNLRKAVILALLAAIPAAAQWLDYPTAGVPKRPDGSPNLSAPAPRMPDGKPDLSGIWTMMCPTAKGLVMCLPETYVSREFADIGRGLDGGLPFQPWAAELHRQRVAENSKDNPDAHCLPMGIMQFHNHFQPRKMIQTPT